MYQALARKWRPKSFASLCGQDHITRALTHALNNEQLHHAYLFTGTRGVGKTSIARILAKSLNCENGVSAEPCGSCQACQAIDAGSFVDVLEIDAASRTRVEDTRDLLDNVQYAPAQGRFKIYLIDEVHMLSTHSFNALLKTLEEPPPHVKFILATTDPDKLPMTILSRCLRLNLNTIPLAVLRQQLETILTKESITFEVPALQQIAQAAKGSMRDALSLLEQAIADGQGSVQQTAVDAMLGLSYQQHMPALLQALFALDLEVALRAVAAMATLGADFETVLAGLLQSLHAMAIAKAVPNIETSLSTFSEVSAELIALKDGVSPETLQLLYQIGVQGQKDLSYAPTLRTGFEMTVLRMIVFYPVTEPDAVVTAPSTPVAKKPMPAPVAPVVAPVQASSAAVPVKAPPAAPVQAQEAPAVTQSAAPTIAQPPTPTNTDIGEKPDWQSLVAELSLTGLTRSLVRHTVLEIWEADRVGLLLDNNQKACLNPQRKAQIQAALSKQLGRTIRLEINLGAVKTQTPDHQEKVLIKEKEVALEASVTSDPLVQHIMETFEGTLEKIVPQDEPTKTV